MKMVMLIVGLAAMAGVAYYGLVGQKEVHRAQQEQVAKDSPGVYIPTGGSPSETMNGARTAAKRIEADSMQRAAETDRETGAAP